MKLSRGLCFIDLESTGVDVAKDRIVEIGIYKLLPDGSPRVWSERFNPGIPIPAEATAIHGIADADVAKCPTFAQMAPSIYKGLRDCDLAGFNLMNFDVPLLWEEFNRCGCWWDLAGIHVIDCGTIFKKKEERTLSAAVKFYLGCDIQGAHCAATDAAITRDVLAGQLKRYPDLSEDVAALAEFSKYDGPQRVDLAGKLLRDQDGTIRFGFGKYQKQPVVEHLDYLEWMLTKEFSRNTKGFVEDILNGVGEIEQERRYFA